MSAKGLGKGISALFSSDAQAQFGSAAPTLINLIEIEPNAGQPRKVFTEEALQELTASIEKHGILQPLAVRKLPNGRYQIIAGERRWRAARAAGLKQVPVHIVEADDQAVMELALVENLQRQDLNPIEEAEGFKTLMDEYHLTQEQVAERVGKSRPAVANALRLLALSPRVRVWVSDGSLSAGHARALLSLSDLAKQETVAVQVLNQALSVRQTELLVKKLQQESAPTQKKSPTEVNYLEEVARNLTSRLGRKVTLVSGRKKGRIELEFYGADDLEQLITQLEQLMKKR
ncbi:MAG: ParB/RepB/Spo0J family partition protein [Oscillospiraceae bacterium]|nr:ParB/RepB/Spo0J family partition protein [Oscillospiraceae bacterium]